MKVLLVQPIKEKKQVINLVPPIGLGYLTTALRDDNDVKILDCVKERLTLGGFREEVMRFKPNLVGITAFSCDLLEVRQMTSAIKEIDQNITTVIGGPHPSGSLDGIFEDVEGVDFAFRGEAEVGMKMLVKSLEDSAPKDDLKNIPGLIWRENGIVCCNDQIFVDNLDDFGFPSWDLLNPQEYHGLPNGVFTKQMPFAPIIATRGCPYSCTFCAGHCIVGKKVRKREIPHILEEIKLLYEQYRVKEIHLEDDCFTFDLDFAKDLCRGIISLKYPLSFSSPNGIRLDRVDDELLELMKEAGWYSIYVGIESGSNRVLKEMRKNLTKEFISKKISMIRRAGLEVAGYFILGYPTETRRDMEETIKFAKDVDLSWAHFATFIPLPGSEVVRDLESKGWVKPKDWSIYFNTEVPFVPDGMSKKELKEIQKRAFFAFYLRPAKIFKLITKIRMHNFWFIFKRIFFYLCTKPKDR